MTKSPLTTPVSVRMYYISSLRWHFCFLNKLLSNVWVPWVPILWIEPFFYNLTNTKTTAESLLSIRKLFHINTRTVWNLGCCGFNFTSVHFIRFFSFFPFTSIPNSLAPPPVLSTPLSDRFSTLRKPEISATCSSWPLLSSTCVPSRWSHGHSSTKHYGNGT